MSSYFDAKQSEAERLVERAEREDCGVHDASLDADLKALEESVVFDCSTCVEFPGCPDDVRARVAACVYKLAVYCQPVNRASEHQPNFDTAGEHARSISNLVWELHTVFHDLAQHQVEGFSDNPHAWGPTRYDPEQETRGEFSHFLPHGSDPEPVYNYYQVDVPRWSRTCSKCGKVEHTKEQRPTGKEPHFR
jgi:hypothetical protein